MLYIRSVVLSSNNGVHLNPNRNPDRSCSSTWLEARAGVRTAAAGPLLSLKQSHELVLSALSSSGEAAAVATGGGSGRIRRSEGRIRQSEGWIRSVLRPLPFSSRGRGPGDDGPVTAAARGRFPSLAIGSNRPGAGSVWCRLQETAASLPPWLCRGVGGGLVARVAAAAWREPSSLAVGSDSPGAESARCQRGGR